MKKCLGAADAPGESLWVAPRGQGLPEPPGCQLHARLLPPPQVMVGLVLAMPQRLQSGPARAAVLPQSRELHANGAAWPSAGVLASTSTAAHSCPGPVAATVSDGCRASSFRERLGAQLVTWPWGPRSPLTSQPQLLAESTNPSVTGRKPQVTARTVQVHLEGMCSVRAVR